MDIKVTRYLNQLILPVVQLYGFDPAGQAAVDARAVQTNKYSQFVGSPLWVCSKPKQQVTIWVRTSLLGNCTTSLKAWMYLNKQKE